MDAAGTRPPRRHAALWTVAVAAAAAGAALRFVAPSPMWLDEVLSVNIASLSVGDAVQALRHDGHPLLYYAVLGVWLDGFGDSDLAARSLSGLDCRCWRRGHGVPHHPRLPRRVRAVSPRGRADGPQLMRGRQDAERGRGPSDP